MAGDRHGKHNTTTISFRVNSYEKATIEERVKVSGMKKQDYIVRSCIYNHVCVVGKKETIEIIRSEMKEMSLVLEDVAKEKVRALFLKEIKEREGREKNKDDDLYEKPSEEELRKVRQLYG